MAIFQYNYIAKKTKKKKQKIKLFDPEFVEKYKNICKIIFNNKLYPLHYEFRFKRKKKKKKEKIKIKLKTFNEIPDSEKINLINFKENKKYKKNNNKYSEYLKYSFNDLSLISYDLHNLSDDKIRIFGEKFVNNNKDKAAIIYKDNIYKFGEYFNISHIDEEDKVNHNFKKILIEFHEITDRSYMFCSCNHLEGFPILQKKDKDKKKKIVLTQKIFLFIVTKAEIVFIQKIHFMMIMKKKKKI